MVPDIEPHGGRQRDLYYLHSRSIHPARFSIFLLLPMFTRSFLPIPYPCGSLPISTVLYLLSVIDAGNIVCGRLDPPTCT